MNYSVISSLIVLLLISLTWLFSIPSANVIINDKIIAYECGFNPFHESHSIFDIKFHLIAILFIIFDLELIYILP